MINTPIELDPDPEPDIRRSSSYHHNPPSPRTAPTTSNTQLPDSHHDGIPDPRIERPGAKRPLDDDTHRAKAVGGNAGAASAGQTEMNPSPPSILLDAQATTLRPNGLGPDVPVSRPTSNRPKVRDFAAQTANAAKSINIAEPLRRATEHLGRVVPAKREGPIDAPGGIPASLVYRPREVGMSNPRNAAGQAPGPGGPADVGSGIGGDEPPVPKKKKKLPSPTLKESIKNTLKGCPVIWLVPVLLPLSWAMHFSHQDPVAIFVTALLCIVPLAGGLSYATEQLASRLGDAWGGLLNATFGNAVELLIAILALVKGELDIVQASMVGSILSNVLLVLGMSYFAGGLRFHEQLYGVVGAQMHISLLGITLTAIVLPAAYHYAYPSTQDIVSQTIRPGSATPEGPELDNLLKMSRGLAFILLSVYGVFLMFQLWTHAYLFRLPRDAPVHPLPGPKPEHGTVFPKPNWVPSIADSSGSSSTSSSRSTGTVNSPFRRFRRWSVKHPRSRSGSDPSTIDEKVARMRDGTDTGYGPSDTNVAVTSAVDLEDVEVDMGNGMIREVPVIGEPDSINEKHPHHHHHHHHAEPARPYGLGDRDQDLADAEAQVGFSPEAEMAENEDDEDHENYRVDEIKISFWFAFALLSLMTALAGVTAEWLIESIDGLTATGNVSREFVALILLPVIGNSVEHITAVTVSVKDKLNLSMSIAVGSSIQVSLCILPILVLIGWAIGQPMILFFDTFETITLVISVLLVNFAISDGRTNYLEGFVMMMAYVSIALVCWFYDPTS